METQEQSVGFSSADRGDFQPTLFHTRCTCCAMRYLSDFYPFTTCFFVEELIRVRAEGEPILLIYRIYLRAMENAEL